MDLISILAILILQFAFVAAVLVAAEWRSRKLIAEDKADAALECAERIAESEKRSQERIEAMREQVDSIHAMAIDEALKYGRVMEWANYVVEAMRHLAPDKAAAIMNYKAWMNQRQEDDLRHARTKAAYMAADSDRYSGGTLD
ncbi:MAG: hypothetical protein M9928_15570 [Anaerolineae bacterium]|nr:hypothetical protein [Anaerolineae bacterium]MCO5194568.1 hypothetical protein [Anaerolineae bacterium]MCO5206455.1 hypothetical protein [Anaerolineae bacterium]